MPRIIVDFPRLLLFLCAVVIAYLLYWQGAFDWVEAHIDGFGYPSIFLAGMLYSFGFTSAFATAYFIAIAPDVSPLPAAMLAGMGSALADTAIFQFVKVSFHEEWLRFRCTQFATRIHAIFHHESLPEFLRRMWKWILACVVIASPLPDEIGITILAGITDIERRRVSVLCFALNTMGILTILLLARR